MSQFDIAVVIVSYNVRSFLDHCLQSVRKASAGLAVQVIVVDNASKDGSATMVRSRYPDVHLIANRENVGFARANNQAFRCVAADAVLILNPDSFVQEDTLQVLWKRLREGDGIGAVGPQIIMPDGRFEPRSMRGFPTPWAAFSFLIGLSALFPRSRFFSRYLLTYLDRHREQEVDALSGCCMMVRRSLLEELGGFDGDYFMYGEDLDLCYRIRQQGYKILYCPRTRIVHFKGESTRRSNIDREYHFHRAMRLFVDKNLAGKLSLLSRGIIALGFWCRKAERHLVSLFSLIAVPLCDLLILNLFILLARWIRFGTPNYTPVVVLVSAIYSLFYLACGIYLGTYGIRRFSGRRALYASSFAGVLSSGFTYFFRQWAFSRFVVLFFVLGMGVAMPAWRILLRGILQRRPSQRTRVWMRRKSLVVGTDPLGREIARQIIANPARDLQPVGYIAFSSDGVGEIIEGIPVLGSVDELDSIIATERIQELIFSTASISYDHIIELIQSLSHHALNFKVIPRQHQATGGELPLIHLEFSGAVNARKRRNAIFRK